MSPRTRLIPLAGALVLLSACGEPPQPLPTSPPLTAASSSVAPSGVPTLPPVVTQPLPTVTVAPAYPTVYPTPNGALPPATTAPITTAPATTAPATKSPTPTPTHAAKCATAPTGAQILALIKGKPGVPSQPLRVFEGPFCSGPWSFTTVEVIGKDEDEVEPLMVVATGKGSTLALVAAGSDVCTDRVQTAAPPGIRVLACGF